MLEFFKKNNPTQLNNETPDPAKKELSRIRKRIGLQAYLAVMTVVLTVVIVFGMTAAWYTNVVHSGGLIFEVEQSGVNVDAVVKAAGFTAKPGDQGIISLSATNKGGAPVDITVSINKADMDPQMQKRLYFYVESQETANGEIGQRSYITAMDGYTYRVLGGKSLTLTEQFHNAPSLKWCWVYDVLGYYVLGQAQADDVVVQEYLRPIEYDYDMATFDEAGRLLTVDGVTGVDSFLMELSQTDGYPGQISQDQMVGRYYQVAVDTSGYGVYAYLCTYQEVEENTDYDTALGAAALAGNTATYSALMTLNAEPTQFKTVTVGSAQALQTVLAEGEAEAIVLGSNLVLESGTTLTIPSGKELLLDLNGHNLTVYTTGSAINMEPDSSLTIVDGTVSGSGAGYFVSMVGAELTLDDVTISGYKRAVSVSDYTGSGQDSTVRISGCNITAKEVAVAIFGNGLGSQQTSKVLIEHSKLVSDGYVISGNGSVYGNGRWGTEIEIISSELIQNGTLDTGAAIYHPQPYSTMNIYDSQITGYNGIVVKGGSVAICNSSVTGIGENPASPSFAVSGYADTADAVYLETGYGYDISLVLRNATLRSFYAKGLGIYEENTAFVVLTTEGTNRIEDKTKG